MVSLNASVHLAGSSGVLLDAAGAGFSDEVQEKIWACAALLRQDIIVLEAIPGMNNLLVTYDPFHAEAAHICDWILDRWEKTIPSFSAGKLIEIPVQYGREMGEDLEDAAGFLGIPPGELVDMHAACTYRVAAVGAMPGFPYLSGLDRRLHIPRKSMPSPKVPIGSVIIAGGQAGIMPTTAPSGWHIIGKTEVKLFNAQCSPPSLLNPGDRVRFLVSEGF